MKTFRSALTSHPILALLVGFSLLHEGFASPPASVASPQAAYPPGLWEGIDEELVEKRIAEFVEQSILEGLEVASLDRIWSEYGQEIRSYGGVAVRSLARLMESQDKDRCLVAIRLLGRIGGALAAPPLIQAARDEFDPQLRIEALKLVVEGNAYLTVSRLLDSVTQSDAQGDASNYAKEVIRQRGEVADPGRLEEVRPDHAELAEETTARPSSESVGVRIEEIMAEVIDSGTILLPEGVTAITRSHPSLSHYREVLEMGPAAIPPLVQYARAGSAFEWYAAQRLVMALGGKEIVAPLAEIVLDPGSFRRRGALTSIVAGTNYLPISNLLQEISLERDSPSSLYARQVLQDAILAPKG